MIDFHCHLDLYHKPANVIHECQKRGVFVLSVTTTPSAWRGTSALAQGKDKIRTALGLHPQLAHQRKGELDLFDELLPAVRYVGEVGLDGGPEFRRHWHDQVDVFQHILESCRVAGGKIISIHSRLATRAVLDCLSAHARAGIALLHWFSGSFSDLDRALAQGCWFTVGPAMLHSAKGRALVARLPLDRVLTESDGPFARHEGQSLMPWDVWKAVEGLAKIWSMAPEQVEETLRENLCRILGSV